MTTERESGQETPTPLTDDAEADAITGEPIGLVAAATMRRIERELTAARAELAAKDERIKELEAALKWSTETLHMRTCVCANCQAARSALTGVPKK